MQNTKTLVRNAITFTTLRHTYQVHTRKVDVSGRYTFKCILARDGEASSTRTHYNDRICFNLCSKIHRIASRNKDWWVAAGIEKNSDAGWPADITELGCRSTSDAISFKTWWNISTIWSTMPWRTSYSTGITEARNGRKNTFLTCGLWSMSPPCSWVYILAWNERWYHKAPATMCNLL